MKSGQPFADPPDAKASSGRIPTYTLVAGPSTMNVGGRQAHGESYNGAYAGPTLRFEPGQAVNVKLVNHLPFATDLHFHGMHLSPEGDQDDVFISVQPGSSFTYHLHIPSDQQQGTFWYHDHVMGSTMAINAGPNFKATTTIPGLLPDGYRPGADIESQILAGLSGVIVVGDDRNLLPTDLQNVVVHTMSLKDTQIQSNGYIVQNSLQNAEAGGYNPNYPEVNLVNGQLRPIVSMAPGQTELWRIANVGSDFFYDLSAQGMSFTVVGTDGMPVSQVTTRNSLYMPPGSRYDVLVTAPTQPGQYWLQQNTDTNSYGPGPQGIDFRSADLVEVKVAGAPVAPVASPSGPLPTAPPDLSTAPIAQSRTVTFSESQTLPDFYMNGMLFDPNKSLFSTTAVLGTVEQWTLTNTSGEFHPFHLHTVHFQVMSVNGVAQPFTGEQDIVDVPYEPPGGNPGQVVIRINFEDYAGRYMFHCHIAAHEDNGMMSFVNVVAPH